MRNSIDYSKLATTIYKTAYKLTEVQDQIEKVGFDIVRFKDADKSADLWQVQQADDGEYIVALYQPEEKVANSWKVVASKINGNLEIFYKGDSLVRVSSSKLGIPKNELNKVEQYLPNKLAENKKLVKALLGELSVVAKQAVLAKYPELS